MDAFQIVNALSASFFGLIGIWAAVVRRHWFLRFVVVSIFLLSTVLVAANQVAIEFGIQIAIIMAGVWVARNWGNWQFRFSIETALLLMVVVAVIAAVLGKTRELSLNRWIFMGTTGVCTAGYGLSSLWLVFGTARLRYRILTALLGIAVFLALFQFSEGVRYAISTFNAGGSWQARLTEHYAGSNVVAWWLSNSRGVLLGSTIITTAILLGRKSGWFSETKSQTQSRQNPLSILLARIGLVLLFLGIASPLVYIFYRLMTPAQYPVVEIVKPNGYDDIIAAGNMLDENMAQTYLNSNVFSRQQLEQTLHEIDAPLARLSIGLARPNFQINRTTESYSSKADNATIYRLASALRVEYAYASQFGTYTQQNEWALKCLQLGKMLSKGWDTGWLEDSAIASFRVTLADMTADECRSLAKQLVAYEKDRPALEQYLLHRKITYENHSWDRHLWAMLSEWSGKSPYKQFEQAYLVRVARVRLLITQLAIQSYFLERRSLPTALNELVPKYLIKVPVDPFTRGKLQYQNLWGGYAIRCSSPNQTVLATGPAAPYLLERINESWQDLKNWADKLSTAQR